MHQLVEDDPQTIDAGIYLDVDPDRIYAIGHNIDREAFERAARIALQASEDEGEPITLWPGREAAIEEIGGSEEHRRWLATRSIEILAGELVAVRLRFSEAVIDCCAEEFGEDEEPDLDFGVLGIRLILNQR